MQSIKQAKQITKFEIAIETNNQQNEANMGKRDIMRRIRFIKYNINQITKQLKNQAACAWT